MTSNSLLVCDFDGVIIDGINEYWWSSRETCIDLLGVNSKASSLPTKVPNSFVKLRPWVHKGWEMVLLTAELARAESPLNRRGVESFSNEYELNCKTALRQSGWDSTQLQNALDQTRSKAIKNDFQYWMSLHKTFPGVIQRLKQLNKEQCDLAILTTKSKKFTAEILSSLQLKTDMLFGYEEGSKADILLAIQKHRIIRGFIEDRRTTLETVLHTPGLEQLTCYLASWGYLKPEDTSSLPRRIRLLSPETFSDPLAQWP